MFRFALVPRVPIQSTVDLLLKSFDPHYFRRQLLDYVVGTLFTIGTPDGRDHINITYLDAPPTRS